MIMLGPAGQPAAAQRPFSGPFGMVAAVWLAALSVLSVAFGVGSAAVAAASAAAASLLLVFYRAGAFRSGGVGGVRGRFEVASATFLGLILFTGVSLYTSDAFPAASDVSAVEVLFDGSVRPAVVAEDSFVVWLYWGVPDAAPPEVASDAGEAAGVRHVVVSSSSAGAPVPDAQVVWELTSGRFGSAQEGSRSVSGAFSAYGADGWSVAVPYSSEDVFCGHVSVSVRFDGLPSRELSFFVACEGEM